ncbi:MAG: hypothetical protein ACM3P1_12600 [Candidatus Saccharibacteria bacterium]
MKFAKLTTLLLLVMLAVSLYFIISWINNLAPDTSSRGMNKWIDILLIWTYILLAISCIATLLLEIAHSIHNKKTVRKSLVFIGCLAVVFLISYLLSDNELPHFHGVETYIANETLTPSVSHCIGTCLFSAYILTALAIVGIVYSYIYQLFN